MGHRQFGARVVYGDCIFLTVSPNEQHSALVLRLSRYRKNDPFLQAYDDVTAEIRKHCGANSPSLEALTSEMNPLRRGQALRSRGTVEDYITDLPAYETRRVSSARDPYAVIAAYDVEIRLRLARLLGVRMCPNCPRCNDRSYASNKRKPCQDKFGSNMMPMGGLLGGCDGFGGATENQTAGTPHFHGEAHVICIYQFGTLQGIAERIKAKLFDPAEVH